MSTIVQRTDSRGAVSFQVKIRKAGFPGLSRTFSDRATAERWGAEQEAAMDRGQLTGADALTGNELFSKVVERYMTEVTPTKRGAGKERAEGKLTGGEWYHLKMIRDSKLGQFAIGKIRAQDIEAYRDARLKDVAPGTVRREMTALSSVLNHARRKWKLGAVESPMRDVDRPADGPARDRRLLDGEEEKLMASCHQTRGGYLVDVVQLALETAMRLGELVNLDWKQVDLQRRVIRLLEGTTKNGHGRPIPLSTRAVAVLENREPRPAMRLGPVFAGVTAPACSRAFERATERAGLEDLHFHDLRHEAISRLVERGLTTLEVASISGHKDLRMLQRYAHLETTRLAAKLG